MSIHFTKHAADKFEVLRRHDVTVSRDQVMDAVTAPEALDESRQPLLIAQKSLAAGRSLRVVYRHDGDTRIIITFYPVLKR